MTRFQRPWRRPRLPNLAKHYDEGWEAPDGAVCPYVGIRGWLWQQGYEDGWVARAMAELVV